MECLIPNVLASYLMEMDTTYFFLCCGALVNKSESLKELADCYRAWVSSIYCIIDCWVFHKIVFQSIIWLHSLHQNFREISLLACSLTTRRDFYWKVFPLTNNSTLCYPPHLMQILHATPTSSTFNSKLAHSSAWSTNGATRIFDLGVTGFQSRVIPAMHCGHTGNTSNPRLAQPSHFCAVTQNVMGAFRFLSLMGLRWLIQMQEVIGWLSATACESGHHWVLISVWWISWNRLFVCWISLYITLCDYEAVLFSFSNWISLSKSVSHKSRVQTCGGGRCCSIWSL